MTARQSRRSNTLSFKICRITHHQLVKSRSVSPFTIVHNLGTLSMRFVLLAFHSWANFSALQVGRTT